MKRHIQSARWLLLRTTDYVALKHLTHMERERLRLEKWGAEQAVGAEPRPPIRSMQMRDGSVKQKGEDQLVKETATYQRKLRAWQRKAQRWVRDQTREYMSTDPRERRYSFDQSAFGTGTTVLARNLVKRLRVMRAPDQRRLSQIETRIQRLQAQRNDLIERAWDRGIPVTVEDMVTLEARSRTAPVRKHYTKVRHHGQSLDHKDSVWPQSIRLEQRAKAGAKIKAATEAA